jgi:hydroxypyruvate isomerase
MPRFSAHISWLFKDLPFLERIDAAAACGFKAVECRFPDGVAAADFRRAAERNKLSVLGINTPSGGDGEFGFCAMPGRQADWEKSFSQTLEYAAIAGASAIHCLAGKVDPANRAAADKVFVDNLKRAADRAAEKNIKLLIEPINPRDQPGYHLQSVEHAADIIAKAGANVYMQFDFFHVQLVGGDLLTRLKTHLAIIGHLQCSQVPVRHEPGADGEINYPFVFAEVDRLGYKGWIGAEYNPSGVTEAGLGWMRPYL